MTGRTKSVPPDMPTVTEYPVAAVKTVHDVIETLLERGNAGPTEVAEAIDTPTSTAHDYLRTLEQVGYVVNDAGSYRLSTTLFHVGKAARDSHALFVHGRSEALGLFESTDGMHVQLATEENDRCAVILATRWRHGSAATDGAHTTATSDTPSTHLHLHTNAPGKAILAHWPSVRVDRLVAEAGLPAQTRHTVTDRDSLVEELQRVRDDGYAVDEGELIVGMHGIAIPITTERTVHGAIGVYSTADRFPDHPGDTALVGKVRDAARTVEANLIFPSA